MKIYEILSEDVAWQNSLSKLIFNPDGGDELDFLLPISSSTLVHLGAEEVRTTVFHVTGYSNLENTIKHQGTKKALSTFFHMTPDKFSTGVQGGGGLIFELDANVLMAGMEDLESRVDNSGWRWITLQYLAQKTKTYDTTGMFDDVPLMVNSLLKKYTKKSYNVHDVFYFWQELGKKLRDKGDVKTLNLLIKDYIDGVYKIYQKYSKDLIKLFREHLSSREPMDSTNDWDEVIANDYKIKKIHVINSEALKKNPQVIDQIKQTKIPYQLWDSPSQISNYVKKVGNTEKAQFATKAEPTKPAAVKKSDPADVAKPVKPPVSQAAIDHIANSVKNITNLTPDIENKIRKDLSRFTLPMLKYIASLDIKFYSDLARQNLSKK